MLHYYMHLSAQNPAPLNKNCKLIEHYLKHWSVTTSVLYSSHHKDHITTTGFLTIGNHRSRGKHQFRYFKI